MSEKQPAKRLRPGPAKEGEPPIPKVIEPDPGDTGAAIVDPTTGAAIEAAGTETGGAESDDEGASGTKGPKPARAPRTEACQVTVTELPATMRTRFTLRVGQGQPIALDNQGRAGVELPVKEGGTIRLEGPKNYKGSWTRTPRDCVGGKLELQAIPADATLEFKDLPQDLQGSKKFLVACITGCDFNGWADQFSVAFDPGENSRTVTVELKASEYGNETREYLLRPGTNPVAAGFTK